MQTRWATLLANATNPHIESDNYPTYVEILRQLSPIEAKYLEYMFVNDTSARRKYPRYF
jgi:hypothetical protein